MGEAEQRPQATPGRIMEFAWAFAPPLMIEAAVRQRVFDVLDSGAKTVGEVSAETGAAARSLSALMDALTGLGLLGKDGDLRYSLTPESAAFLVNHQPGFLGGLFRHLSTRQVPLWLSLTEVVSTGSPAAGVSGGTKQSVEAFQQQVEDLYAMNYPAAQTLVEVLEVRAAERELNVLDLEAGSGVLGVALAQASPHMKVTAIDWPEVLPVTRRNAERFGVAGRYRFVEGDIFKADFGGGYHVATLGHLLNSETEEAGRILLKKTFEALAPGGVIAIVEAFTNEERTGPPHALVLTVQTLLQAGPGGMISFGEVDRRLKAAGFEDARIVETPSPFPIILAKKP